MDKVAFGLKRARTNASLCSPQAWLGGLGQHELDTPRGPVPGARHPQTRLGSRCSPRPTFRIQSEYPFRHGATILQPRSAGLGIAAAILRQASPQMNG